MFTALSAMVVAVAGILPSVSLGATYSEELQGAYNWAYGKKITTMSSIDNANMYGAITRAELAKMLANWAKDGGKTPDTSKACTFTDTASVKGDLAVAIVEACQLGLMGQGITAFRPYDTISRAEFGTALSRALWGSKYEGGNPYYVNHLNALKAEWIMNQISNAVATKEVRGYVMLMLQRSEWSAGSSSEVSESDKLIGCLEKCAKDVDCISACYGEEKEDSSDDEVVRAGSLQVTAKAASLKKAINDATSDLDTLTFKTSEEVEITKVTLERYGYSEAEDVLGVWLEDEDGNTIAESKTLNSKDKVTLSINKDWRKVDGSLNATIVVKLKNTGHSSIGFKVVDVVSTAEDLDIDNYSPTEYEIVSYAAVKASFDPKGAVKNYNYEEGESYEVAKFKVKAATSPLLVKGFTLTNKYAGLVKLDMKEFLDDVKVMMDWEEIKWANFSVDGDKLTVSFKEVEIEAKGNATFAVEIILADFDGYGQGVLFWLANASDLNATEKKTWAKVSLDMPSTCLAAAGGHTPVSAAAVAAGFDCKVGGWAGAPDGNWYYDTFAETWTATHEFNGSKIKLSNTKLSNIDAAQNSTDIVVAEGSIELSEAIKFQNDYTVTAVYNKNSSVIEEMHLIVAGDEYDATPSALTPCDDVICTAWPTNNYVTFTFSNIEIEKSGKFQIKVDINTDAALWTVVTFYNSSFSKAAIVTNWAAQYSDAKKLVLIGDVAWSISFATKLTVQQSKASLENSLTDEVEFVQNEGGRKVIFDGTYTARKGDVDLNKVLVYGDAPTGGNEITFHVFIDEKEVATADRAINENDVAHEETFSNIRVKAGESVKVKVEAEVDAYGPEEELNYTVLLIGSDDNGNEGAGKWDDTCVLVKIKAKGSITIPASAEAKTALLKAQNTTIASFRVKPSNNNEGISFEDMQISAKVDGVAKQAKDFRVKVDGVEQTPDDDNATTFIYSVNEELPSEGLLVEVILKNNTAGKVDVKVEKVNGKDINNTYSKYLVDSLVSFTKQDEGSSSTTYALEVKHSNDAYSIKNFRMIACGAAKYSADGAAAFNAKLPGAVKSGDAYDAVAAQVTITFWDVHDAIVAGALTVAGTAWTITALAENTAWTVVWTNDTAWVYAFDADDFKAANAIVAWASATDAVNNVVWAAAGNYDADGAKAYNATLPGAVTTADDQSVKFIAEVSDWEEFSIMRAADPVEICEVSYDIMNGTTPVDEVSIDKNNYKDYFKAGGKELTIPAK